MRACGKISKLGNYKQFCLSFLSAFKHFSKRVKYHILDFFFLIYQGRILEKFVYQSGAEIMAKGYYKCEDRTLVFGPR